MKSILVQLDESTYRALEQVAPVAERKRARFIREAIRKAVREQEEERMRLAYLAQPDLEPGDDWSNAGAYHA